MSGGQNDNAGTWLDVQTFLTLVALLLGAAALMTLSRGLLAAPSGRGGTAAQGRGKQPIARRAKPASSTLRKAGKDESTDDGNEELLDSYRDEAFARGEKTALKKDWKDKGAHKHFAILFEQDKIESKTGLKKGRFLDIMQDAFNAGVECNAELREEMNRPPPTLPSQVPISPSQPLTSEEIAERTRQAAERHRQEVARHIGLILQAVEQGRGYERYPKGHPRAGCVKNGPSYSVPNSCAAEVYLHFLNLEGQNYNGTNYTFHIVRKQAPRNYNITLHGSSDRYNPKTDSNVHIDNQG